jgi:formylglycine-generating enzyme required for sulfatase activity
VDPVTVSKREVIAMVVPAQKPEQSLAVLRERPRFLSYKFGHRCYSWVASGCYRANQFGLYDMLGNVAEWCFDRYAINTYEAAETYDPTGPENGVDGKPLAQHVYRGGGWNAPPIRCTALYRSCNEANYCSYDVGFRVVCEVTQTNPFVDMIQKLKGGN